jgi:glycosyltransferase involved in cell wall biosynthesis
VRAAGADVKVLQVTGARGVKYLSALRRLGQYADWADVIHAHYCYCGWLARLRFRKPVVVSFMGDDLLGTPNDVGNVGLVSKLIVHTSRWLAHTVDAVIVKSQEMADVIAPTICHVVPNGVDIEAFQPRDRRDVQRQLGWSTDRRYVLFPGNPACARKGFATAKAAFDRAASEFLQPVELVALWNVSMENVPLYMNACDAMLMTSYVEGSPNVVKEAMASDLPVISVPVGDVAQLIDGVPGYWMCPRQTDVLSHALVTSLAAENRVEGRAALLRQGLDLETVAGQILDIYDSIVTNHRRRSPCRPNEAMVG